MSWLKFCDNPESIYRIFDDNGLSNDCVSVQEVCLHRDGPCLRIVFDLMSYPKRPPTKWNKFNTVQVSLNLIGVRDLEISGSGVNIVGDLVARTTEGKLVEFEFTAIHGKLHLIGKADVLRIESISGYLNETRS